MKNWLDLGNYNAICDSCGRKFKANTMRRRWDGLFVCKEDWEQKHPQLTIRVRGDKQQVPIPRPEAPDQFLAFCSPTGSSDIIDYAIIDCAKPDYLSPVFDPASYPIACIPLNLTTDETIQSNQTVWACSQAYINASYTINGTLGVY